MKSFHIFIFCDNDKVMNSFGLFNFIPRLELLRSFGISRTKLSDALTKYTNDVNIRESEKRLLKIAIIGAPNAGKSTLINQIVKRKVFPISKKVHTTRFRARAIYNEDNVQLVFLDTPGLVTISESEKYKLHPEFVSGGEDAIVEADVIGIVHDLSNHYTQKQLDSKVLRLLHLYKNKESFLILNKIDTVKSKRHLLDLTKKLTCGILKKNRSSEENSLSEKRIQDIIKNKKTWENFSNIFMISALLGTGITELKTYLLSAAHFGNWLFPENVFTDQNHNQLIKETVRSKLLEYLPQEVPYNLKVELEYLDLDQEGSISAVVIIGCETPKYEKLVIGKGRRIKTIAAEAEQALSDAFLTNFRLRLVVCSNQL